MAAAPSKTINDLSGNWLLNKSLSDSPDPGLALQGIGWLTRKGIGLASVSLDVKHYVGTPVPGTDPAMTAEEAASPCTRVDITQSASGLTSTVENRSLDNRWRGHEDWLFGKVRGRSFWLSDPAGDALKELLPNDGEAQAWLADGWLGGDEERAGPGGEAWIATYVESAKGGWTALQVWGFQTVAAERRHCRRVLIRKGSKKAMFRLVYDFLLVDEDEDDDDDELPRIQ